MKPNKKLKIANCILDEKFIDGVIYSHQMLNKEDVFHDYIFINNNSQYVFRQIKKIECIKIISPKDILVYLEKHQYDAVFIHSLYSFPIRLIPQIQKTIKVCWFAWGYDLYELPYYKPFVPLKLYHERTKEFTTIPIKSRLNILRSSLNFLKECLNVRYFYKILKRVDYFSGIIPDEYSLISKNKKFKAKQVQYNYVSQSFFEILNNEDYKLEGNNILIGNSADPTNNHIDVFEHLKQYKLDNRNIIVPLSYSGYKEYKDAVCTYGNKLFSENFISLMTFMPYVDYINLINSCSIAIFYHERQQALGNIIASLINGCKVFLSKTSPLYVFLKNQNIIVYSIQEHLNQKELETKLSYYEIFHNRTILKKIYGEKAYINNINNIYNLIKN